MANAKELSFEEAEKISGGMPNPNSMTPEEWEAWKEKHNPDSKHGEKIVFVKDADGNLVKKEINIPRPIGATQN